METLPAGSIRSFVCSVWLLLMWVQKIEGDRLVASAFDSEPRDVGLVVAKY